MLKYPPERDRMIRFSRVGRFHRKNYFFYLFILRFGVYYKSEILMPNMLGISRPTTIRFRLVYDA